MPDIVAWWGGAQTGYLHVATRYRVGEPLMMVSTWDGDELSLVREHHQLRAVRRYDVPALADTLTAALAPCAREGLLVRGLGVHQIIEAGERADELIDRLRSRGIVARRHRGGRIAITPPLDRVELVAQALRGVFS